MEELFKLDPELWYGMVGGDRCYHSVRLSLPIGLNCYCLYKKVNNSFMSYCTSNDMNLIRRLGSALGQKRKSGGSIPFPHSPLGGPNEAPLQKMSPYFASSPNQGLSSTQ